MTASRKTYRNCTRFALRTADTSIYVYDLQPHTMPAACDGVVHAKTWASARGALTAAKRHRLTNVEAVPVAFDAAGTPTIPNK